MKKNNLANILRSIIDLDIAMMLQRMMHEINGVKKDTSSAMLYLKRGSKYVLAVMGCDSDITNN